MAKKVNKSLREKPRNSYRLPKYLPVHVHGGNIVHHDGKAPGMPGHGLIPSIDIALTGKTAEVVTFDLQHMALKWAPSNLCRFLCRAPHA